MLWELEGVLDGLEKQRKQLQILNRGFADSSQLPIFFNGIIYCLISGLQCESTQVLMRFAVALLLPELTPFPALSWLQFLHCLSFHVNG